MAKKKPQLPLGVLPDLLTWWRRTRVKGVVIGGLAVAFRGRARTTRDVDAIIFMDEDQWPAFLKKGEKLSFRPRIPDALDFAMKNRVLLMCHHDTNTEVDLSLGSLPFERQVLARAQRVKVGRLAVPFATAEDLIVLKAIANRPLDLGDIDGVLDRTVDLDLAYVLKHVDEFAEELETPAIMEDLERLLTRHQAKRRKKKN